MHSSLTYSQDTDGKIGLPDAIIDQYVIKNPKTDDEKILANDIPILIYMLRRYFVFTYQEWEDVILESVVTLLETRKRYPTLRYGFAHRLLLRLRANIARRLQFLFTRYSVAKKNTVGKLRALPRVQSLSEGLNEDEDLLIPDISTQDDLDAKLELEEHNRIINDGLKYLTDIQRTFMCETLGINGYDKLSTIEIANRHNVSTVYVGQVKKAIIKRYKKRYIDRYKRSN